MRNINEYLLRRKKVTLPLLIFMWVIGMSLWLSDIYTAWSIPVIVVTQIINLYGWAIFLNDYIERNGRTGK